MFLVLNFLLPPCRTVILEKQNVSRSHWFSYSSPPNKKTKKVIDNAVNTSGQGTEQTKGSYQFSIEEIGLETNAIVDREDAFIQVKT